MTEPHPPEPVEDLDHLLLDILMALHGVFVRRSAEAGITLLQATTLQVLRNPLSMGALAELLDCDASTVTSLADRLERLELVERRLDPSDRRVKILGLTPSGEALRQAMDTSVVHEVFDLDRIGLADVAGLVKTLRGLLVETAPRPRPTPAAAPLA